MSEVQPPAAGGQPTDPSAAPPVQIPILRWDDPAAVRRWLSDVRAQALDAIAAGKDATRKPKKRMFSRYEARRRLREAEESLLALLQAAERSLPAEETKR